MITNINLLPWRDNLIMLSRIEYRNKIILSILLGISLTLVIHNLISHAQNKQQEINALIQIKSTEIDAEISVLQRLLLENQLKQDKQDLIQQLQIKRLETTSLMADIPALVPDGIFLTVIDQHDHEISFTGYAASNNQISEFMQSIENSQWLQKPILIEIKTNSLKSNFLFNLSASQQPQSLDKYYGLN